MEIELAKTKTFDKNSSLKSLFIARTTLPVARAVSQATRREALFILYLERFYSPVAPFIIKGHPLLPLGGRARFTKNQKLVTN